MSQTTSTPGATRLIRLAALLLVAAGLAVAGGAGWKWLGKVRQVSHQQQRLDRVLTEQWAAPATPAGGATAQAAPAGARGTVLRRTPTGLAGPAAGTPIARLHLPTVGVSLVVVEGAADAQLAQGPGRMAETAPFGEPGNTALAAHRYPGVFWDLDRIGAGDPLVVETAGAWLVYRTARTVIVEPADGSVLAAPPGTAPPTLTLITCEPKLSTAQRLVKQATLVRTDPRDGPRPRELSTSSRR